MSLVLRPAGTSILSCLVSSSWKSLFLIFCLFGFGCFSRECISSPGFSTLVTGASLKHFNKWSYTFLSSDKTSAWDTQDNSDFFGGNISLSGEYWKQKTISGPGCESYIYLPSSPERWSYLDQNSVIYPWREGHQQRLGGMCGRNHVTNFIIMLLLFLIIFPTWCWNWLQGSEREPWMAVTDFRDYCCLGVTNRFFSYNLEPDTWKFQIY